MSRYSKATYPITRVFTSFVSVWVLQIQTHTLSPQDYSFLYTLLSVASLLYTLMVIPLNSHIVSTYYSCRNSPLPSLGRLNSPVIARACAATLATILMCCFTAFALWKGGYNLSSGIASVIASIALYSASFFFNAEFLILASYRIGSLAIKNLVSIATTILFVLFWYRSHPSIESSIFLLSIPWLASLVLSLLMYFPRSKISVDGLYRAKPFHLLVDIWNEFKRAFHFSIYHASAALTSSLVPLFIPFASASLQSTYPTFVAIERVISLTSMPIAILSEPLVAKTFIVDRLSSSERIKIAISSLSFKILCAYLALISLAAPFFLFNILSLFIPLHSFGVPPSIMFLLPLLLLVVFGELVSAGISLPVIKPSPLATLSIVILLSSFIAFAFVLTRVSPGPIFLVCLFFPAYLFKSSSIVFFLLASRGTSGLSRRV